MYACDTGCTNIVFPRYIERWNIWTLKLSQKSAVIGISFVIMHGFLTDYGYLWHLQRKWDYRSWTNIINKETDNWLNSSPRQPTQMVVECYHRYRRREYGQNIRERNIQLQRRIHKALLCLKENFSLFNTIPNGIIKTFLFLKQKVQSVLSKHWIQ